MGVVLTSPRPTHGSLNWDTALEADLTALASGINAPVTLAASTDLNALTASGLYQGNTLVNAPGGSNQTFFLWVIRRDVNGSAQIALNISANAMWQRTQTAGAWSAWFRVNDSGQDTGWVTASTGITAATGWTLNGSPAYRNDNGVVSIDVAVTKATAATATANAAGIIASTPVVLLPGGLTPPTSNGVFHASGGVSTAFATGFARSSGDIAIGALAPSTSIPVGGILDLKGTYLL